MQNAKTWVSLKDSHRTDTIYFFFREVPSLVRFLETGSRKRKTERVLLKARGREC